MTITFDFEIRYQSTNIRSIDGVEYTLVIRLSLVKMRNVVRTISHAFKVSLTKSFPVVQKKNDRRFCDNREFWTDKM